MAQYEENQTMGVFDIAKTAANVYFNPLLWYGFDPSRYSITRGQIRLPYSPKALRFIANTVRRFGGEKVIAGIKKTIPFNTGGVLQTKEVWAGLSQDPDKMFGISRVIDPSTIGMPKIVEQTIQQTTDITKPKPIPIIKTHLTKKRIINRNFSNISDLPDKILADPIQSYTYSKVKRTYIAGRNRKIVNEKMTVLKTRISNEIRDELPKLQKASFFPKLKDIDIKSGLKGYAKTLGKVGTRVGIFGLKSFAYYNSARLMWDAINFIAEPLGRSIVQGADYALRKYDLIPKPELGGQLAMSYLSQGAATERQRAISAISKSFINGRNSLGNEASYIHR